MITLLEQAKTIDLALSQNPDVTDHRIFVRLNVELEVYVVTEYASKIKSFVSEIEDKYWVTFKILNQEEMENSSALESMFANNTTSHIDLGLKYRLHSLLDKQENVSSNNDSKCPVVTFYSYKGGMGRTTTLCGYALDIALNKKKRVVIVDCDFEAPGYLNFFRLANDLSILSGETNGVIEYLLDRDFSKTPLSIDKYYIRLDASNYSDYKYNAEHLNGIDNIYILPSGNLSSNLVNEDDEEGGKHRDHYLQGLARLDLSRNEKVIDCFKSLFKEINETIKPDVILIDSRTGFNDIFGTTALALSNVIVGFFGSTEQTKPGLHFLLDKFYKTIAENENGESQVKLILINSILPNDKNKSEVFYNRFSSYVSHYSQNIQEEAQDNLQDESNYYLPIPLSLSRNNELEGIGLIENIVEEQELDYRDDDYIKLVKESAFEDYKVIFKQIDSLIFTQKESSLEGSDLEDPINYILRHLQNILPELYAEDTEIESHNFFYRDCMIELFERDKIIVQGFKGTGKTYLYKALKEAKYSDIQNELRNRAAKTDDFRFIDIITEAGKEGNKSFDFSSLRLSSIKDKNYYFKHFWLVYTWNSVMLDAKEKLGYTSLLQDKVKSITRDLSTSRRFSEIIDNEAELIKIEEDLKRLDHFLENQNIKLIVLYDQLDNLVKPDSWGTVISPLVDYWRNLPFENIFSKIFIRTDLFERLAGTNLERLQLRNIISIEWSRDEIYSYLFKLVFSNKTSKANVFKLMRTGGISEENFISEIESELEKTQNQLPLKRSVLEPFMTVFFGKEVMAKKSLGTPYDWFYFNLNNADQKTISLRPFINLIKGSVNSSLQEQSNYLPGVHYPVIHYKNYSSMENRDKAVEAHFRDLTREEFNQDLKVIFDYLREFGDKYKHIYLTKVELNCFLKEVYTHNKSSGLQSKSADELRRLLEANGIIHENPRPDGNIYYFAQLYKFWLGLKARTWQPRNRPSNTVNKPIKPKPIKKQI